MSAGKSTKQKKAEYFERLVSYLETYPKILVVTCDNIGSAHMQKIRKALRGKAVLLMGKNTMIRRAIRLNVHRNEQWNNILPLIFGNVGLVFTKQDLSEVRDAVQSLRVPAAAKAGIFAPKDVFVPKGMTTLEPTKTSFLQALNIASKINKGQIELLNDTHLIKKGDRVGSSEAALLQMLDVKPFEYGLLAVNVYDNGSVYDPAVLDLKDSDIVAKFGAGVAKVASLSLGLNYPTLPAFPHVVLRGFKNLAAVAIETDYDFSQVKKLKDFVKNPTAFAAAAAPAAAPAAAGGAKKAEAPKVEEKPKEPSDEPAAFDLFG
jgi:large subunit ribosomal protein LP0